MAKTADTTKWSHESYAFSDRYDEALLPLLETVDPTKNNFIVIHIMGSHIYYNDRYPHEFSKWKQGPYPDGQEAYANSSYIQTGYYNKFIPTVKIIEFTSYGILLRSR